MTCPWCGKEWTHYYLVMDHNLKGCPALKSQKRGR